MKQTTPEIRERRNINVTFLLASEAKIPGGMEKQLSLQAKYLAQQQDFVVTIIASESFKSLFSDKINFLSANMRRSRKNPLLLLQILKKIKDSKPNILHAHGHKAASLAKSLRPFLNADIKLVATCHGLKSRNQELAAMNKVLAVSPSIQRHLFPIPSEYLPNGIEHKINEQVKKLDRTHFINELNISNSDPIILGVGRLAPVKRYDLLVSAAENLPINLVIVGDGPERNVLTSSAGSNVYFTGHRNDILELMRCADLLVICSEREGFSLTLIEALLSNLPVISTKVPGSIDVLPESCLIDELSSSAIKAKIQSVLLNYDSFKGTMQKTFEHASKTFTINNNVQQLTSVYRQITTKGTTFDTL